MFGFKKKDDVNKFKNNINTNELKNDVDVNEFKNDAIQTIVLTMISKKIINEPQMRFLNDDKNISENFFELLMNSDTIKPIFSVDHKRYLLVLAYHAFGAGIYVPMQQLKLNKELAQFDEVDVAKILNDMYKVGSVVLGLEAAGIGVESDNKKVIDHVLMSSLDTIFNDYSNQLKDDNFIRAFLELYYNAGVTFAMR